MPASYFLLQTQYHAAFILLNRPFVQYGDGECAGAAKSTDDAKRAHFTQLSRSICAENATLIVEVFEKYRVNYDLAQMFGTGLAHIGTAATTLMGEALLLTDPVPRAAVISQLFSLRETITLVATTYPPGHHMIHVVDEFIRSDQLQHNDSTPRSTAPQTSICHDSRPVNVGRAGHVPTYTQEEGQCTPGLPKQTAVVGNTFHFTPTVMPAPPSLQGLPCLPTTFLESLDFADLAFSDQGGYSDYGFAWNDTEVG